MTIEKILEILENYKLRIPPTVFYEIKADIVNCKEQEPILDKLIDDIECTTWYHINRNGELVEGANSAEDDALYKAKDILKVLEKYRREEK